MAELSDWGGNVLDLACGAGANLFYFAKKYPEVEWVGMDIDEELLKIFPRYGQCIDNVKLTQGDWFSLPDKYVGFFEGIISLQTLSWLPEWQEPLKQVCKLQPKWFAMSSLFYEGDMDYIIKCYNYERPDEKHGRDYTEGYYNIYSLPHIKRFLASMGYGKFIYEPFEIDVDIPRPKSYDWGTYTETTSDGRRLQLSGALLMPWYFIYAEKTA